MQSLLLAKSLTVRIAGTLVCQDLNFTVNAGDRWGIIGVNGVGKTTLLHTLAGLYHATSGEIYYKDTALPELSNRQRAQFRGVLFQDKSDPFPATVLESVLIGRHPYIDHWQWESKRDIEIARDNIHKMELSNRESQLVNTLSGGERQRVAIATLLTQQSTILMLDEPTSHLDLKNQMDVMKAFHHLTNNNESATVMILHDLNIASRFCNKILMLFGEGKTMQGESREMLTDELLMKVYGYPVKQIVNGENRVFVPG